MNNKTVNDLNKFRDVKGVKKNLIDASLFLSFYEILNSAIVDRISEFYNDNFIDRKQINTEEYKQDILNKKIDGKSNIFLSSCHWLIDRNVITKDEYDSILNFKEIRNKIAHNLPDFLFDSDYKLDETVFQQIKGIVLKIEKWWIASEFTLISNNNEGMDIDDILPSKVFRLNYIFNIANTNLDEFENLLKGTPFEK